MRLTQKRRKVVEQRRHCRQLAIAGSAVLKLLQSKREALSYLSVTLNLGSTNVQHLKQYDYM